MINTPYFLNSRIWILENLQPFDWQAYVSTLLAQYPVIPEEFRIWILEWPARLAIACMWPDLSFTCCRESGAMRRHGVNWLGYKNESPELLAVIYEHRTPDVKFIPGLLIWKDTSTTDWLIFDKNAPDLFGRVYVTDCMELESSAIIPHERQPKPKVYDDPEPEIENIGSEEEVDEFQEERPYADLEVYVDPIYEDGYLNVPYSDWIKYLENHWAFTVKYILYLGGSPPLPDWHISEPVETLFNESMPDTLPTFP